MSAVVQAQDGDEALEILEDGTAIHLILLDQMLPKRSGIEVLRVVKSRWPWIPVIIITGFGSEDLAVQALRAGANDYLKKPIGLDVLHDTVRNLVGVSAAVAWNPTGENPSIRRALTFIAEHSAEEITLEDAAREAGLSRYYFCRLFRRETGATFLNYLRHQRIRQAEALLANRHMRITDVAYTVGFRDLSHFDRTFRRVAGRSPSEYRASLKSA